MDAAEKQLLTMILNEIQAIRLHLTSKDGGDNPASQVHVSSSETQLIETIRQLSIKMQQRGDPSGMVDEVEIFAKSSATEDETRNMLSKLVRNGYLMQPSPSRYVVIG